MECPSCGSSLTRPSDFCLACRTSSAAACVVTVDGATATVQTLSETAVVDTDSISYTPETGKLERRAERNFIDRIVAAIRRKRPPRVYVDGSHSIQRALRARLSMDMFTVPDTDGSVSEAVLGHLGTEALPTIEARARDKVGGAHSTLIGERDGEQAVRTIAQNPHVKKVIPGPIEAGGTSRGGFEATISRVDENGNLRVLLKNGGTVQTVRVVTTGQNKDHGAAIKKELEQSLLT